MRASRVRWSTSTRSARSGQPGLEHRLDGGVLVLGVAGEEVRRRRRTWAASAARATPCDGSRRPASVVTENSSTRIPLWMSL